MESPLFAMFFFFFFFFFLLLLLQENVEYINEKYSY